MPTRRHIKKYLADDYMLLRVPVFAGYLLKVIVYSVSAWKLICEKQSIQFFYINIRFRFTLENS